MRISLSVAALALLFQAAPLGSQTLRGTVLDDETGEPIEGATVHLQAAKDTTADGGARVGSFRTGADGTFVLRQQMSGMFLLIVSHMGYQQFRSEAFVIGPREELHVEVRLSAQAIPLEPLTVTARRLPSDYSARLARIGHYERRAIYGPEGSGFGRFIGAEEIERRGAFYVTDLLKGVPGLSVRGGSGRRPPAVYMRSVTGITGGECRPTFFINRTRIGAAEIDQFLSARDIAAIEVYPGITGAPAEFTSLGLCGVVVILTK